MALQMKFLQRITDDFLIQMAREAREKREKREAEVREEEEESKQYFLKNKWNKILSFLAENYKGIDIEAEILDHRVAAEIRRCMIIPSEFLRTSFVRDCPHCSKGLWKDHERYNPVRHPMHEELDFDGHFPEDHVQLPIGIMQAGDGKVFEERSNDEKNKMRKKRMLFILLVILVVVRFIIIMVRTSHISRRSVHGALFFYNFCPAGKSKVPKDFFSGNSFGISGIFNEFIQIDKK